MVSPTEQPTSQGRRNRLDLPTLIRILSQSMGGAPGHVVRGKDDLGGLVKGKERK